MCTLQFDKLIAAPSVNIDQHSLYGNMRHYMRASTSDYSTSVLDSKTTGPLLYIFFVDEYCWTLSQTCSKLGLIRPYQVDNINIIHLGWILAFIHTCGFRGVCMWTHFSMNMLPSSAFSSGLGLWINRPAHPDVISSLATHIRLIWPRIFFILTKRGQSRSGGIYGCTSWYTG